MRNRSNRLAVLAESIKAAHADICSNAEHTAKRAVEAGEWLAEAKNDDGIPRGGWDRWVEDVAGVPNSTARHYIKLFRATTEQALTLADIAHSGQIGALKGVAEEIRRREEAEPEDDDVPAVVWSADEVTRRTLAEQGQCVVANMRESGDAALIAWAEAHNLFVRIDRKTEWGNPFEMPDDGDRAQVVGKFSKFYLPYKDGLLSRMSALRGKVLGCWCHPDECHGHLIADVVNREANGEGSAEQIADSIAEVDG